MGEPGENFFLFRIDDVKKGEMTAPTESGATPGVVGNRFKIGVSDEGAIEIYAAGRGVPVSNTAGFKLSLSTEGELKIQCAKKITLTHGDADESINSLSLDPAGGVEIKSMAGLKVNGKKLVNEDLVDWMVQNMGTLYSAPAGGGPCILGPAFPIFIAKSMLPDQAGGYKTAGVPVPATGVTLQPDLFETIPIA